jgi:phage terminase Nu1 subunit (DNA packaging protein)
MKKGTPAEEVKRRLQKAMERSTPEAIAAVVDEDEEGPAFVDTQPELADEIGVDKRSIIRWSREGGAPRKVKGKYDVQAWKRWMADTGKESSTPAEPASPMKAELELRKLTAQCERLEMENKIKLGQFHTNDDCKLWVGKAMTAVRTILLSMPSKMAPVVEMRSKEECEPLLRDAIDEALIAIHEKEWPSSK